MFVFIYDQYIKVFYSLLETSGWSWIMPPLQLFHLSIKAPIENKRSGRLQIDLMNGDDHAKENPDKEAVKAATAPCPCSLCLHNCKHKQTKRGLVP